MTQAHRRRRVVWVLGTTIALVLAACGPRKPHADYLAAARGDTAARSARGSGAAQPAAASADGVGAQDASATAAAGSADVAAAAPSGQGGAASPGGSQAGGAAGGGSGDAQTAGANGASDVGVTADSILVGNITSVGGPLGPNVFSPSYYGAAAYFRQLNEKGGINGRKIKMVTCDDKEDPNLDLQCAQSMIANQKVFAFVANNTRVENGAAHYVNSKGVPVVGDFCIGNWCAKYPHYFGSYGSNYPRDGKSVGVNGKLYAQDGLYKWLKEKMGVTKAAVFFYSIAISRQGGLLYAQGLERQGIQVVYYGGGSDQGENPAAPTFDTDVIQMKSKGVDLIVNAIDMNGFEKLCQSMDRYNFTVKVNLGNPQAYGQIVGDFSSPCRNTVFSSDAEKSYADTSDPAVAEMRAAMAKYYPNVQMHQWVLTGWAQAKLFADAVKSLGPNVTRAGLEKYLNSVQGYTNGGLTAAHNWTWPFDFSKPSNDCFSVVQWQDSAKSMVTRAPLSTCYTMPWVAYEPIDDGS